MSIISRLLVIVVLLFASGQLNAQPDSLLTVADSVVTADSLTVSQELGEKIRGLHPVEIEMQERKASNNNWIFFVMLLVLGLVALVRAGFAIQWQSVMQAFSNMNIAQQVYRDRLVGQSLGAFLLNLVFLIVVASFTFLVLKHFGYLPQLHPMASFGLIMAALCLYYVFRLGLLRLLAFILPIGEMLGFYRFNILLTNKLLGLALIPVVLVVAFSYQALVLPFIYIGFTFILGFLIVKLIKGLIVARPILVEYQFHFLLYICTLEIAPLVIATKLILNGAFHLAN